MTKNEFYEKWKAGSSDVTVTFNKEEMIRDLDKVIFEAVSGWNDFADQHFGAYVDLDEYMISEAEAIEKRK